MANILLVDDDFAVRYSVSKVLSRAGHHVVCAVDGIDALKWLESVAADLLISDVVMPELGGLALLSQVRARYAALPVLMMSAGSTQLQDDFVHLAMSMGANGVVVKPFEAKTLLAKVDELLPGRAG